MTDHHNAARTPRCEGEYFGAVLERRLDRRSLFKVALGGAGRTPRPSEAATALNFRSLPPNAAEDAVTVSAGHRSDVLLRWGDPILKNAPPWNPASQTAAAQQKQFGYNNDFMAFLPLPIGSKTVENGLLWVNHEYTNPEIMFPGYDAQNPSKVQVDVELAAHGGTVVEVKRGSDGRWQVVLDSKYNLRITATTPTELTGPAAGSDWMKTGADTAGLKVLGMLNNCAGGWTPWGTVLTCEENFQQYFANWNGIPANDPRKGVHARYGLPARASERKWELYYSRFDLGEEPNEPNRFGWVVELDPYNPEFTPKKRTALGFFSQADVLVQTRRAADLLGATMMDRPEDIEPNPVTGKVYLVMTNNNQRTETGSRGVNAANPRANNRSGHCHILELEETGGNASADTFRWNMFLVCGDPGDPSTYFAGFPKDQVSSIGAPDNILFDVDGNLWICSDGQPSALNIQDSIYAVPVDGAERGHVRRFLNSVPGSEVASAIFNPDSTALFVSIQHPGEGGTYEKPISKFPDGSAVVRPSVLVATNLSGNRVGVVSGADAGPLPAAPAPSTPAALPNTGDAPGILGAMAMGAGAAALAVGSLLRLRTRRNREETDTPGQPPQH